LRLHASAVLFVILLWQPLTLAQESSGTTKPRLSPEGLRVLAECRAVMGTIPQYSTAAGQITRSSDRVVQRLNIRAMRGAVRFDVTGVEGVFVTTAGKRIQASSVRNGSKEKMRFGDAVHFRPEYLPAEACHIAEDDPTLHVEFRSIEKIGGLATFRVEVYQLPDKPFAGVERALSEYHVFVDVETRRIVKIRNSVFSPDVIENRSSWEILYSDYRTIGTALVPFRYERYLSGKKFDEVTLTSVDLSTPISISELE
jgi:hypothetical protein